MKFYNEMFLVQEIWFWVISNYSLHLNANSASCIWKTIILRETKIRSSHLSTFKQNKWLLDMAKNNSVIEISMNEMRNCLERMFLKASELHRKLKCVGFCTLLSNKEVCELHYYTLDYAYIRNCSCFPILVLFELHIVVILYQG